MKAIEIMVALAISLSAIAGIGSAITPGDFQFSEQINRPGNFNFADTANMEGWNTWSHESIASAGAFESNSIFKTLDVPCGSAPEEKSFEEVTLNFFKNGQTVDPLIGERIDSDITVGAFNNVKPDFTTAGDITGDPNARYDIMKYNIGGTAGADGSRFVNSQILSSQDDYIHARGFDSAGNLNPVVTSFTDVVIPGMPGTDESQAYRQFNWQDSRGWKPVVGDANGAWDISNLIDYKLYEIPFNVGK